MCFNKEGDAFASPSLLYTLVTFILLATKLRRNQPETIAMNIHYLNLLIIF